ncbi:MAG TPA: hypothetical protein VEK08_23070 [Planctomycetota bacterium]|nr:hypothetical protein [Planctomycetota bacterium]
MARKQRRSSEVQQGRKKKVPPVAQASEALGPAEEAAEDIRNDELPPLDTADSPGPGESMPTDEGMPHGVGQAAEKLPDTEKLSGDVGKLIQGTTGGMAEPEHQIRRARRASQKPKKSDGKAKASPPGQPSERSETDK